MRILLVEDDQLLGESLKYQLEAEGFAVDLCSNGEDGLHYILEAPYDLLLLDRMLPGTDGVAVLKELRRRGCAVPVILLTALGELADKIQGLDAGADDYIVKPFAFGEIMARIRSVTRRPRAWENIPLFRFGDLTLSPTENLLKGPGGECRLSKRESQLMEALLRNPGQTLPRETLLLRVWGPDTEVEAGNLDNYVHFLRRRIRFVKSVVALSTIRGVGYRLEGV
jgi:DNA-binding response OmpR family regulator